MRHSVTIVDLRGMTMKELGDYRAIFEEVAERQRTRLITQAEKALERKAWWREKRIRAEQRVREARSWPKRIQHTLVLIIISNREMWCESRNERLKEALQKKEEQIRGRLEEIEGQTSLRILAAYTGGQAFRGQQLPC